MSKTLINENSIIYLLLLIILWLSQLYFGIPTAATTGLDASWTQALGYVFKHDYQAGIDYIFNHGPLGYLYHSFSSYDADLFYLFVIAQMGASLLLAIIFIAISFQMKGVDKFLYFFLRGS